MKAIQVKGAHNLVEVEVEKAELKFPTDVLVKVKRVGICGTDMHIYHGTNPLATLPRVVGHEVAGEVVDVGREVDKLKKGDHVVIEPISYCGNCYACRKGKSFSFRVDIKGIVLAEPYTIGAQATWRGNVEKGDSVLIQGAGPIGICILKLAKMKGATVMMTDLNEERLQFAKESGADAVVHVGREDVRTRVKEWTNREGVNIVIDAVCLPSTFELSVDVVSQAGNIVVLGFDERPASIPQLPITKKEVTITGSRLQTHQFSTIVQYLNKGKLSHNGLITHKFPLSRVQEAFDFIENYPEQVRKAVITLND
ncbi:zinc-binding alcohol dehydrogenase family protein [Priestia filamentosa]|nr:zinc-binding alcohol dehydrogenase family protein [Priestia filamentosa]